MTTTAGGGRHSLADIDPDGGIERSTLPDGVRVITQEMAHATSISIGVYVGIGSRDEAPADAGASHFLEHLLFKGTDERSARQIAMAVEAVGGEMNAYTAREHTAFYLRLPPGALEEGFALLTDVVREPALRASDIDAEREVILEELHQAEDTPDDVLHMRLWAAMFPDHALGWDSLGTESALAALGPAELRHFHEAWYRPGSIVVAAAGALDHDQVVEAVLHRLPGPPTGGVPDRSAPSAPIDELVVERRATEQVQIALGWPGVSLHDDDRYALWIANQVLGGASSSRLFQQVREERGLAYTVYSSAASYVDCGVASISAATTPGRVGELLEVVDAVLVGLADHGITAEEHRVALGYLEGSVLLGLEDSGSRMGRLATGLLARGRVVPVDEHLARLRAVTPEEVHAVLRRIYLAPRTLALVGPFDAGDRTLAGALARAAALR